MIQHDLMIQREHDYVICSEDQRLTAANKANHSMGS